MDTNKKGEMLLSEVFINGKDSPHVKVTINKNSSALYVFINEPFCRLFSDDN